jgi:adenylylsulfate kinase
MTEGFTIWITGLPGSGKTSLARDLEESLLERGLDVERLDAGDIRRAWLPTLGYTRQEQTGYLRLLGHFCNLLTRNGAIVIVAAVSPYQELRKELRDQIGRLIEVYLKCPLEICEQRDQSGMFMKARSGEIGEFPGISLPYEESEITEVVLESDRASPEDCCAKVLKTLEVLGNIPEVKWQEYDQEEEAKIAQRLKDLGYL